MKHYYVVNHDTTLNRWGIDWDESHDRFQLESIYDTESNEWVRSIIGTTSAPNDEKLADELAAGLEQLNAKNTAAAQITDVTNAAASPAFSASATAPLRSAENPCTGGEPVGWAVYCADHNGDWIETGFSDEEAAERFATAWRNYSDANTARPCLLIVDSRDEWEGDTITAYLGCGNECGHEQEFSGWLDSSDRAHFPCPNCGAIFEHSDWSEFFDEDETNE